MKKIMLEKEDTKFGFQCIEKGCNGRASVGRYCIWHAMDSEEIPPKNKRKKK